MKNWIKILIALVLGFIIGLVVIKSKTTIKEVTIEKPVYYQDLVTIHDLENLVKQKNLEIQELKNRVQEVKEVVIIEKEQIQKLPPDSGVVKLREFLEDYTDAVPDTFPTLTSDSLVLLDNENLRNINSVFLDYFGAVEIIFDQGEIIYNDSIVIGSLDSIIGIETGIRENLETALTQEKKRKNIWMGVGIGATITTLILGVLSYGRSGN